MVVVMDLEKSLFVISGCKMVLSSETSNVSGNWPLLNQLSFGDCLLRDSQIWGS